MSISGPTFALPPLARADHAVHRATERLATGRRINRAADDAAGLAIASALDAERRVVAAARRNIHHGTAAIRIADAGLHTQQDLVTRARELAVQAGNGILGAGERAALAAEFQSVVEEIDRIGSQTRFNGFALLDGSASGIEIRVGGGAGSADGVALSIEASTADTLGDGTASLRDLDIGTEAGAGDALAVLAAASDQISANRATAGAVSNRLETADRAAAVTIEHAMSAHSQIMDLDIPEGASALSTAAALRKMGLTAVSIQNRQRGMLLDRLV